MAKQRNRRRATVGGTVAVFVIGTAVLLYFLFRDHFAAALVGVVGLILGVASLLLGIIPLISAGGGRTSPTPPVEPQPKVPTAPRQPAVEIHSGRDTYYAGRDMKVGTDGSTHAKPDSTPTRRRRSDDASPDEEADD